MKLFTGWVVSAGLVVTAAAANAQVLVPNHIGRPGYAAVSDFEGPYAAMPPDAPVPRYGYGPALLPPQEVYLVVRENGFSPLGALQQRGFIYTIAVIDRRGDDGRLVIDGRTGRILRFIPAYYRMGDNPREDMPAAYGLPGPPPVSPIRGGPRPPASIPHLASRTPPAVPLPRGTPPHGDVKPLAAEPAPQQAAVQAKPVDTPTAAPAAAPAAVAAKPAAPPILPTQEMPKAQGLD
ncbi:hypothetical protein [Bradyrhizobium erythrophlei]|jgi:hypothetical protein|uniref:Nickel/cobalt transporter regulator n=1 Tax=Bradyrhizobium erythrophlei TaxID=1437360 RepID=A0A1M5LG02_9BRAD|nr:hypothetical protein [Bradyrhizobium erythrophlei]SHG63895.1 hypothetical protein SAMN05444169_3441 [Bradyrhizobium erythrophlei]